MKAPVAAKRPVRLTKHGDTRTDNYYWLRNRKSKTVLQYLESENKYTDHVLKPIKKFRKDLYKEMRSRIVEDESSAPFFKNGYWYYERYEKGKEHPIFCRKKEDITSREEIVLDANKLSKGHKYYELVSYTISPDNEWVAFAEDLTGRRLYRIQFKNLKTGKILPDKITNCGSDLAWLNDNKTLFYTKKDTITLRPDKVYSHTVGSKKDRLHYFEKDEAFICGVSRSKDDQFIFIGTYSSTTTEFYFSSASVGTNFELFLKRKKGHEYYPDSAGDVFIVKSNLDAPNFKIAQCSAKNRQPKSWKILQKHDANILLEDFEVYDEYLVIQEKANGLTRLKIHNRKNGKIRLIPPFEETYTLYLGTNPEYKYKTVRIGYSSLTTPHTTYDIRLSNGKKTIAGQTQVLGGFKSSDYKSERIWIRSHDGTRVPVSIVYHKTKFRKDGKNPLLLYAYGSYGSNLDPYFSSPRLSLLNRGFVFAIAHIRGGEELGRHWYDQGRMLNKKNTFLDFIAAGEQLIHLNYASPTKLYAMGGSAGGLLMGAVANMRPQLWAGIVSSVPFVDVVTTMLDTSIPLTTGEFDEWGNPENKTYYRYMKSYSPYDNIESKNYPAMLVTAGLHDSQVQYWEPAKYVAKLRALKTDQNHLLLYTNMDAGHGGASGRYEHLNEIALEFGFLLFLDGQLK